MVLPHRSRRESNLRKTPLSDNVWQGRFYIVFKGNVYFDEREQNRLVFKGRLRWIFQMLIVGNHHLSMMQHRNMFNYQRFSILIGTNKFLTKNSFSMYKCKPLFFSFLLILPIMFLISCSDDTVEEMGGSNHVLLERYGSADFPGW